MTMCTTAPTQSLSLSMAKEQVLSWLHDEESLVTSQRIQQHCQKDSDDGNGNGNDDATENDDDDDDEDLLVNRREGSLLLREIYETDPCNYVATLCTFETFRSVPVLKKNENVTTTDKDDDDDYDDDDEPTIVENTLTSMKTCNAEEYKTTGEYIVEMKSNESNRIESNRIKRRVDVDPLCSIVL